MGSIDFKPKNLLEVTPIRSASHDVTLIHKVYTSNYGPTAFPDIPTAAATEPPKATAPTESSGYGYGGYAGYGYGSSPGYASYVNWDYDYLNSYSVDRKIDGQDLKIHFSQRDLDGTTEHRPASSIVASSTAIIFINQKDSDFMSKLFDSELPSRANEVEKNAISFIVVYDKSETTDEFAVQVATWIGAHTIASENISSLFEHKPAKAFLDSIANKMVAVQYKPEVISRFKLLEAVRFLKLDDVKRLETNQIEDVDPIGNSVLHLALHNPNTEVFFYLGQKYPRLLNLSNIYHQTPFSAIGTMRGRNPSTEFFDWKIFWTLPFEFSEEIRFTWSDMPWYYLCVFELVRNREVWIRAKERIEAREDFLRYVLVKLSTALRIANRPGEEALEALKLFESEGVDIRGDVMHTFIKHGFLECIKYYIEKGHRIADKDIVAVFEEGWIGAMEYLTGVPEFNSMSETWKDQVMQQLVKKGFNNLLRKAAKQGFNLPLSAAEGVRLSTANIIARANAKKVVSLKHVCVNALYEVHGESNVHAAVAAAPEDVRSLFVNQNRYQWVLYLDDEMRQRQLLKLYEALSRSERKDNAIQLTVDGCTFSLNYEDNYHSHCAEMWLGGLNQIDASPHYICHRYDRGEMTSGGYYEEWTETKHERQDIFKKILDSIGWDISDAYVFMCVLSRHLVGRNSKGEDEIRIHTFTQEPAAITFYQIPDWYKDFFKGHFGVDVTAKP